MTVESQITDGEGAPARALRLLWWSIGRACLGDSVAAMELALSLEKLVNEKLLHLHKVLPELW